MARPQIEIRRMGDSLLLRDNGSGRLIEVPVGAETSANFPMTSEGFGKEYKAYVAGAQRKTQRWLRRHWSTATPYAPLPHLPLPGADTDAPHIGSPLGSKLNQAQIKREKEWEAGINWSMEGFGADSQYGSLVTARSSAPTAPRETTDVRLPPGINYSIVKLHALGLIGALVEIADYHPSRNVPPPPLWKDDEEYLSDIKALLYEVRRLNDLLQAKTPDPAKVEESGNAIAYAAKRISDGAYDTLGKGLGYAILGSLGLLAYQLGASSDLVRLIMSGRN